MLVNMRRRHVLPVLSSLGLRAQSIEVKRITNPPGFHWFGYYDKLQFDPTGRFLLGQRVNFEHRSPRAEDEIVIGVIDTREANQWRTIGSTRAWNWQQGAMLQWLPGSATRILWNDRHGNQFVCRIFDLATGKTETIPAPVYTLSPDGRSAIAPDFRRLNDCRPGYGYAGIPDPNASHPAPDSAGIWRIDLRSGKQRLLIPFSEAVAIAPREPYSAGAKHWFNHLLYSPDGSRFIFLHRWRGQKEGAGFSTRMFTAGANGKDLFILDPHGRTSHFIWRDPRHVLAWAGHPMRPTDRFYLHQDRTNQVEIVGENIMTVNGHCSYLPGNRWILNDTYPDRNRLQHLYLFEVATSRRVPLASLLSPKEYTGEWRTDLHPRFSPDGRKVCIDSTHEGLGRQLYLLDISSVL